MMTVIWPSLSSKIPVTINFIGEFENYEVIYRCRQVSAGVGKHADYRLR